MRTAHILLLCILGAALLSAVHGSSAVGPDDCCFQFYPRRMNKNVIKSYYPTDHRCPKTGVILVTKRFGRHICVDQSLSWVKGIMRFVDENSF